MRSSSSAAALKWDASALRLRVEAASADDMDLLMTELLGLGCTAVDPGDAELRVSEKDSCAPEDFYSTTNQRTLVRVRGQWLEARSQRMDAMIVVRDGVAVCRRLRDLRAGDPVVVGMKGIRVVPEAKERDRLAFAFMSNDISSERQVEMSVSQTAALMHQARAEGKRIVAVAGPVVVHTGGCAAITKLIRGGWIDSLLAGNALAVHDIESALTPQPYARHQCNQPRRQHCGGGGVGPAHQRCDVRMREGGRAFRSGRQSTR